MYNSEINYNGYYNYDSSLEFNRYVISVVVLGVSTTNHAEYETNFRLFFSQTQPLRIHLDNIIFL